MQIKGVITALVTPFKNGELNEEGLRQNIRHQIAAGVEGVLALGTTGETPTLSENEQKRVIDITVEEAKGKVLVMLGTGTNCTATTQKKTKEAMEAGADAALVVTPYYNCPTQNGIYAHFEAVSKIGFPICVYNIEKRCGRNIETNTLKRIAKLDSVIAVKEASGSVAQAADVLEQCTSDLSDFSVVSGDDGLTLPMMSLGAKGVISVLSNAFPSEIVKMVAAANAGDFTEARRIHFRLAPLFRTAFIESNPIPIKWVMEEIGLAGGDCRLPLLPFSVEGRQLMSDVLSNLNIEEKVGV
ncbi:MAG: 4-hydroxy-tetrahydrodipicolinate synthase [Waddliaceae bacterium]|nr:4-hydroxy-tetrahydrodipicolinate synthase [Waddliaceae bacterium]